MARKDRTDAIDVGRRKQLVIVVVNAREAAKAGVPFSVGNDKLWLADCVPLPFIAIDG